MAPTTTAPPTATRGETAALAAADVAGALDYIDAVSELLDWLPLSLVPASVHSQGETAPATRQRHRH